MKVLGYHVWGHGAVNSEGEAIGDLSLIEFLLRPKEGTIRIFYDLDFSMNHLLHSLKMTPKETGILVDTTKYHIPPYNVRYVPGKFMSVKRSNGFSYYSNASQYVTHTAKQLLLHPHILAEKAKEVGEYVGEVFKELGVEVTSLTSPARAYEKSQVEFLAKELKNASSAVKVSIIENIGLEVFGRTWEDYKRR